MKTLFAFIIVTLVTAGAFPSPLMAQDVETDSLAADKATDVAVTDQAAIAFFEQKIRPLLIDRCFACHSQAAEENNGGLWLDSRQAILQGGDNGPAVNLENGLASLLLTAVRYEDADIAMPPDGRLAAHEIQLLEDWIRLGAPFPSSPTEAGPERPKIDIEAAKQHWSFQPLEVPDKPTINRPFWTKNRIDTFIASLQESHGLLPQSDASRTVLLRRAKFDLLGIPPTPEEIADFQRDPSASAFQKRIDAWLASPLYGERWARHWLELVRYCDVAEQWAESQGNNYFYRDWVINALNEDLPFDRFTKLQLAADLMPDAAPQDQAALGFLGLSPTYWKELQLPVEIIKTIVSDEYEERIHTWSSTFLGLNVACARCHDHKVDPITNEDYYAIAGVFANTRIADRALNAGVDGLAVYEAHKQAKELQRQLDSKQGDLAAAMTALEKLQATPGYSLPLAPGVMEGRLTVVDAEGTHGSRLVYQDSPQDVAVEVRGNPNKLANIVPRRYLSVLSTSSTPNFQQGSGRLELAETMFAESSPLIARVIVNRIWKQHFGRGIVNTPSDFGLQGERPSHPLLLEDLAARFVQHGWSLKWLHREIMQSATYQQASIASSSTDPDNHFYTYFPIRRLDVEAWRDAMLFCTERMELSIGGPAQELSQSDNRRRTIYGLVRRRELTDILRLYDVPDPVTHSPQRIPTSTPLQQLFVLNSPFMMEQAAALVARIDRHASQEHSSSDTATRVKTMYQWLFGREPTTAELELANHFLQDGSVASWQQYAQALLGSNEFAFID
jgi:hypothetical protein